MRDDQYHRLQALEEKLTDVLLTEADPATWTAPGVESKDLSQQQRGDRYWCKKNAVATISLTIRVGSLIGTIQRNSAAGTGGGAVPESGENLLDAEVADAEREAKKLLSRLSKRDGKARAAHGRE
jgi:hypothetical protein